MWFTCMHVYQTQSWLIIIISDIDSHADAGDRKNSKELAKVRLLKSCKHGKDHHIHAQFTYMHTHSGHASMCTI